MITLLLATTDIVIHGLSLMASRVIIVVFSVTVAFLLGTALAAWRLAHPPLTLPAGRLPAAAGDRTPAGSPLIGRRRPSSTIERAP